MKYVCLIGESDMKDFTPWWESHLPAWLVVCCLRGEAELMLEFKPYAFRQGMTAVVAPDMFPAFTARSEEFRVFYCLIDRESAESLFYDFPKNFFDALYAAPVVSTGETMGRWADILSSVYEEKGNTYRKTIFSDLLHAFILDYYNRWEQQHGTLPPKDEKNPAELICRKFCNLVFDHFKEHRTTAFYADRLCITPCYLAMVTRQICRETPKQAIDRQVTLEMKYLLRNTAMTAEQMAHHLHFPDPSYMCRYFRRQTGLSLSEYRKNGG